MRLHRSAIAAAVVAAILAPCAALGAGYGIYEQGAVALGMAGASTASIHDASANFYNPAALVRLDGRQFSLGASWLGTRVSFAGIEPSPGFGVTESMKNGNFFPPNAYWANHLGPNWAYGVSLTSPWGLGVEWNDPATFSGRARVTKATLHALNGGLNLAWSANKMLSIAAGYDMLFSNVELHNVSQVVDPRGGGALLDAAKVELKSGYKSGSGFNVAVLWSPKDDWRLGGTYRSKINVKIDGADATFTQIPSGDPNVDAQIAANLPPNQGVSTTLHFPAMYSLGAAWNPAADWTWEADFNWTQWKAFDALVLTFDKTPSINTSIVENYKDSFRLGLGAEHRLAGYTYRFGYYFDQAAAPVESVTPLLPDANRHGATLGLGWKLGAKKAWSVDLYNLALFVENRSTEGKERDHYDGVYKSYVDAAGVNIGYHW